MLNKKKLIPGVLVVSLVLLVFVLFVSFGFDSKNTEKTINFSSMTLDEKISQMIIVKGDSYGKEFTENNAGGIFLNDISDSWKYKYVIRRYRRNFDINPLIATDMEGYWNPFEDFYESKSFEEVEDKEEAYELGKEHGKILFKLGFSINFAPVTEFRDEAYGERAFKGNKTEVEKKIKNYLDGIKDQGIYATCKHYPGKGMIKDLHIQKDIRNISEKDLELFEACFENNVSFIMIGHQIVEGKLDSEEKPSSVSKEVLSSIPEQVLRVSDEINMKGLDTDYSSRKEKYADLINAGNDIILDFELKPENYSSFVNSLKKEVKKGNINETEINNSVKKILRIKGYKLKNG